MSLPDVARSAVQGLSGSPALLLVAVLNVVMILGVGYVARSQADERREMRARDDQVIKVLTELCARGNPP